MQNHQYVTHSCNKKFWISIEHVLKLATYFSNSIRKWNIYNFQFSGCCTFNFFWEEVSIEVSIVLHCLNPWKILQSLIFEQEITGIWLINTKRCIQPCSCCGFSSRGDLVVAQVLLEVLGIIICLMWKAHKAKMKTKTCASCSSKRLQLVQRTQIWKKCAWKR